jgi:hypothetical protein
VKRQYLGVPRQNISLRSTLTRIAALTRRLSGDIYYASDPATQRYWNDYHKRQSRLSIARLQAETLSLLATVPEPYAEQLVEVTKAVWRAAYVVEDFYDRGNPAAPLLKRQAELIAQARAALLPARRSAPAARRLAA